MNLSYGILIVDDVADNIQIAMNILKEDNYNFSFARSGEEALLLLEKNDFDLVLLDVMMPGIDGFEVCKRIKANEETADIPVIFLTAKADSESVAYGFKVGGVDYIAKPFQAEELLARVRTHLELYRAKKILKLNNVSLQVKMESERKRILGELEATQKEMLFMLMEMIEAISDETGNHVRRVAEVSRFLALKHPSLKEEDAELIYYTAPMHDVGKLAIPYEILHKPTRLSEEEFEIMKTHTTQAHKFLKVPNRKIMQAADIIAYQHHEKYNGTGYPQGLKGEEIHIYARIVALADVLDALTHKRTYKDAWSIEKTVEYIVEHKGTQFDPLVVDIFLENQERIIELLQME